MRWMDHAPAVVIFGLRHKDPRSLAQSIMQRMVHEGVDVSWIDSNFKVTPSPFHPNSIAKGRAVRSSSAPRRSPLVALGSSCPQVHSQVRGGPDRDSSSAAERFPQFMVEAQPHLDLSGVLLEEPVASE